MLLYVVRYYSVRTECGQAYLLKDLLEIKLPKDDTGAKLEPWFIHWSEVYYSMVEGPSPSFMASIRETFENSLRNCGRDFRS
eukprot:6227123-Prorocentrum_lima.AAC.1